MKKSLKQLQELPLKEKLILSNRLSRRRENLFVSTTMLKNLEQHTENQWPLDNDKKDNFCQGIQRVLDIQPDSKRR